MREDIKGLKNWWPGASDITAVFCANDITAVGAMRAFRDSGLSIPKDISVIGVDDIESSKYPCSAFDYNTHTD